jgi:hypothetical protein
MMRQSLLMGVVYIAALEGMLGSFQTVGRRLAMTYYFRVLVLRWLDPTGGRNWAINLATAPPARTCVLTLLAVGVVSAILAALVFAAREFRMKTPEGN